MALRDWWVLFLAAVAVVGSGCATSFVGDAHFPGGPAGCQQQCHSQHMEMDSFVYMGEYSSGCVCRPPGGARASTSGSGMAGAAGVMLQMRAAAEQQRQQAQ